MVVKDRELINNMQGCIRNFKYYKPNNLFRTVKDSPTYILL